LKTRLGLKSALKRLASGVQLPTWPPTNFESIACLSLLIHHICSKFHKSIIFDVRNRLCSLCLKIGQMGWASTKSTAKSSLLLLLVSSLTNLGWRYTCFCLLNDWHEFAARFLPETPISVFAPPMATAVARRFHRIAKGVRQTLPTRLKRIILSGTCKVSSSLGACRPRPVNWSH